MLEYGAFPPLYYSLADAECGAAEGGASCQLAEFRQHSGSKLAACSTLCRTRGRKTNAAEKRRTANCIARRGKSVRETISVEAAKCGTASVLQLPLPRFLP